VFNLKDTEKATALVLGVLGVLALGAILYSSAFGSGELNETNNYFDSNKIQLTTVSQGNLKKHSFSFEENKYIVLVVSENQPTLIDEETAFLTEEGTKTFVLNPKETSLEFLAPKNALIFPAERNMFYALSDSVKNELVSALESINPTDEAKIKEVQKAFFS
jgi:hypothetical protein